MGRACVVRGRTSAFSNAMARSCIALNSGVGSCRYSSLSLALAGPALETTKKKVRWTGQVNQPHHTTPQHAAVGPPHPQSIHRSPHPHAPGRQEGRRAEPCQARAPEHAPQLLLPGHAGALCPHDEAVWPRRRGRRTEEGAGGGGRQRQHDEDVAHHAFVGWCLSCVVWLGEGGGWLRACPIRARTWSMTFNPVSDGGVIRTDVAA